MHSLRMTMCTRLIVPILVLTIVSCKDESSPAAEALSPESVRTLQSLQTVNDYPLYVMTYFGDYGFRTLLTADGGDPAPSEEKLRPVEEEEWLCTCFAAYGDSIAPVFGRNFDWRHRACLLIFTDPPDGYASVSMVDIYYCGYTSDLDLTSLEQRRGLLNAPFTPFDGMNEKGVAIGIMAVPYVQAPYDPGKRSLSDLGIVRLVLDYAEDTDHAIWLIRNYNVRMDEVPLHFLIADRSGTSAVIEFVNYEIKVMYNHLPYQVSTNFVLHDYFPSLLGRCWRYDLAYDVLQDKAGKILMSDARDILRNVSQSNTMWSSVYGLKSGEIQIVTGRQYDSVYRTNLTVTH
jgi:hypothetical protein